MTEDTYTRREVLKTGLSLVGGLLLSPVANALEKTVSSPSPELTAHMEDFGRRYKIKDDVLEKLTQAASQVRYRQPIAASELLGEFDPQGKIVVQEPIHCSEDPSKIKQVIVAEGLASVYSVHAAANETATGAPLRDDLPTGAINPRLGWQYPSFGVVTHPEKDKKQYFLVWDKGPYEKQNGVFVPHKDRVIDLSPALAEDIGIFQGMKDGRPLGLGNVVVRYIEPLPNRLIGKE